MILEEIRYLIIVTGEESFYNAFLPFVHKHRGIGPVAKY